MLHVDAQNFAEMRRQILAVALRVLLRTGVAHRDVEKSVGTESDAAAAVVLRYAHGLPQTPRRLAGVTAQIGRRFAFDDGSHNPALLKHLMLEIVFAVLAELRMKRQAEQPVRTAFVEDVLRHIREQCL